MDSVHVTDTIPTLAPRSSGSGCSSTTLTETYTPGHSSATPGADPREEDIWTAAARHSLSGQSDSGLDETSGRAGTQAGKAEKLSQRDIDEQLTALAALTASIQARVDALRALAGKEKSATRGDPTCGFFINGGCPINPAKDLDGVSMPETLNPESTHADSESETIHSGWDSETIFAESESETI